ncbi:XRE family transcriptional regulator [Ligilactobacillus murinus]|uniref:XRE family transcriptional regulator n=1 Tax=Ligilactobacillus murinus TaxID=1622 RepID=A0A4S2E883_9LACO|nr:XRE family transcriptional regulator [Ligilactobacillus murinus]TGY51638.1 XRE family transcriptional regulator [Ligilactobacillus murinus]
MKNNREIVDQIILLAKQQGLSLSELARRVGMAKSAVSSYFNKTREFPLNRLTAFASALNVSPEELLGIDLYPQNVYPLSHQTTKIPILGAIACGAPIDAVENVDEYITVHSGTLPKGNLFYLVAKGDSMYPTIPDGAYVLIREQSEVEDGEIAAVLLENDTQATLKRIKKEADIVLLLPDNSSYDPIIITKDTPVRIIGKAVQFFSNL